MQGKKAVIGLGTEILPTKVSLYFGHPKKEEHINMHP